MENGNRDGLGRRAGWSRGGWFTLWILCGAVAACAAGGPVDSGGGFSWPAFLGPFHTVILHYPIGFVTMMVLIEACLLLHPQPELRKAVGWISILTACSAIAAASLGWMRGEGGGYDPVVLERHRWTGVVVASLTALTALTCRKAFRHDSPAAWRVAYRSSLLMSFGALVVAAHLGGSLTHGSTYLTDHAPAFIREIAGAAVKGGPPAVTGTNSVYTSTIAPIFAKKCAQCHGPEKQKGKFRLDLPEKLLAGGDSGKAAVKPGDPLGSELVRLVTLPRDHEDAMPPDGKPALTPEEIVAVIQWIHGGAKFD